MGGNILVKICGITREADALAACAAGADLLGYVLYPNSKRAIAPPDAARIIAAVRTRHPAVRHVALFVDQSPAAILAAVAASGVDLAQLHGTETDTVCRQVIDSGTPMMKALKFGPGAPAVNWRDYDACEFLLCDTYDAALVGGTGRAFDPALLPPDLPMHRTLVAGGLTAATVGALVRTLGPAGVDVSSAVEIAPGIKSPELMREFIAAARSAG